MKFTDNTLFLRSLVQSSVLSSIVTLTLTIGSEAETLVDLNLSPEVRIEQRFANTEINSVSCENFGTLCQVISGTSVFYVNPNATHAFIGRVFDLETNRDLTELTINKLKVSNVDQNSDHNSSEGSISWASLPLNDAITRNKKGKYEVAVISDIHCAYCRKFSSQIDRIPEIKVYEFLIGTGSTRDISNRIACSEAPEQALESYYSKRQFQSPDCDRNITASANKIARQIDLQGTPTFIRPDGQILIGFESIQKLSDWITEPTAR